MAEPFDTSADLARVVRLATLPGEQEFPGRQPVKIAPTPGAHRSMFTAHRVDDTLRGLAHSMQRCAELKKAKTPDERRYQSAHLANHLGFCLDQMHALAENLRQNYPPEAKELEAVRQTTGLARALSPASKVATTAHLTETILHELTHGKRHADLMMKTDPAAVWQFNCDHAAKHVRGAHEHAAKLAQHLLDNYPEEGRWLRKLGELASPPTLVRAAATQPLMTAAQANYRDADVDGQTCHTCLNRTGGSCRLVNIITSPKYVCDSYEALAELASPSMFPVGKPYRNSFLTEQRGVISAPGAGTFDYGQLRQEPSQTVSPSPPLPPAVDLPSPQQLSKFADQLGKMQDDDENHHLAAAVMHMTSAAEKITNNPVSALASLRSAQTAIQQEWRGRVERSRPRVAYVFSPETPPAEQSSAQQVHHRAQAQIGQMQAAAAKVAGFIDQVRRAYFRHAGMDHQTAGGGLAGQPNARL